MLTRRRMMIGTTAAGICAALPARADIECGPFTPMGVRQCTAGLKIGLMRIAVQQCPNWCWAACIEAVFALHGYEVSQEAIVERLFGTRVCAPAIGPQIIGTIQGTWQTDDGEEFRAYAEPLLDLQFGVFRPDAAAQAAQELAGDNPLINGTLGHATVLTAMTYLVDMYGNGQPQSLTVRDPWPRNSSGRATRRQLTPNEVYGTQFLARIRVS